MMEAPGCPRGLLPARKPLRSNKKDQQRSVKHVHH